MTTGIPLDIIFDSTECTNCTKAEKTEFSNKYDNNVVYFDNEQKWEAVICTLCMNIEGDMDIDLPAQIPWQYRNCNSVYNG